MSRTRWRFAGEIAGAGSTSGVRVVVGRWTHTPLGSFADAMVETTTRHRLLLAPSPEVADFVTATYTFDEVRTEPVEVVATDTAWTLTSPSLVLVLGRGRRTPTGRLLRAVPARLATAPAWCAVTDPVARVAMRGVRTRGRTGSGPGARREWYGATDHHALTSLRGTLDGADLGALAPVDPPASFGFSSSPPQPSVTAVTTTVEWG